MALTEAGLVESRSRAQVLIVAGRVRVDGETVRRPDARLRPEQKLEVSAGRRWVSRGGDKLDPALEHFGVEVLGRICVDIGASTGGFTDVLLSRGASLVFAVDVGRGLIDWRLRSDPRVILMEKTNARNLERFDQPVSRLVVDVSFIGLEKVLPALCRAAPGAEMVCLFKPQFQVGRSDVGKGGVVRDVALTGAALARLREWCGPQGLEWLGQVPAAITGSDGNQEWFIHLRSQG
ncbi:MAG: TlyA family RNA methyltransferase [Candidatus Dormibacteraceae bacterium]